MSSETTVQSFWLEEVSNNNHDDPDNNNNNKTTHIQISWVPQQKES